MWGKCDLVASGVYRWTRHFPETREADVSESVLSRKLAREMGSGLTAMPGIAVY